MSKNIENVTNLLIDNFIYSKPQQMEDITQAFEYLNDIHSMETKAYIGNAVFRAMIKLNLAKLKTQKLILNAELH